MTSKISDSTRTSALNTIAWVTFLVIMLEWVPYFLQNLLYFYDIENTTILDYIQIGTIFLSPFLIAIYCRIGRKHRESLLKFFSKLFPWLCMGATIFCWLYHYAYFQIGLVPDNPVFEEESATPILGMVGSHTPLTQLLFLLVNVLLVFGILPVVYIIITNGTGKLIIRRETNLAFLIFGCYMGFRFGGLTGGPLRLAILFTLIMIFWIIFLPSQDRSPAHPTPSAEKEESSMAEKGPLEKIQEFSEAWIDIGQLPTFVPAGILFLVAFLLGAPAFTMNGLLNKSWVWFGLAIGAGIVEFSVQHEDLFQTELAGWFSLVFEIVLFCCLLMSQIYAPLIQYQSVWLILSLGMLPLVLYSLPFNLVLLPNVQCHRWVKHPIRHFALHFGFIISFLIPYLAGLYDPFTDLAFLIYFLGLMLLMLGKNRKQRRKNTT